MADDIENDDQWLYGENQDPEPEQPPKESPEKPPQTEPPAESKSPPKVSVSVVFCCANFFFLKIFNLYCSNKSINKMSSRRTT